MPGPLLLYPGEVSHLLDLVDVLAEQYAGRAAARLAEIAKRKASGAPLDDGDGAIEPLPAYESPPHIAGVRAAFVVLSERRRRTLLGQESSAWAAMVAAKDDADAIVAATDRLFDARRSFIRESVAEVHVEGQAAFTPAELQRDDVLDVLERAHLVTALAAGAAAAQDLPRGKVWRSGPPPASTSTASTAASAPPIGDQGAAVTVALPPTSSALGTSRTLAPGGT